MTRFHYADDEGFPSRDVDMQMYVQHAVLGTSMLSRGWQPHVALLGNHPFLTIVIGSASAQQQADKGVSFVIFFESLYLVDNRITP
ncbi:hypothetical protein LG331_16380 [Vreelandella aquamarina]|uniref:hypothetical protein n=1 Tax=Vreelandella aquamarina TaxID=77097 RepID=UPI00384E5EAD